MTELAREYGEGLYDLACEEGTSAEILAQLETLVSVFREQPDFVRLLGNMALSREERVAIIDSTLRGQVDGYLLNFLKILCERGILPELRGCEEAYRARYNADNGVIGATVTTAEPMDDKQRAELAERLCRMTGRQVVLTEKVDPAVMGGVLLEMNGQRYDNTLKNRLKSIHSAMVQGA